MRVALVTESFLPSLNGVTTSVLRVSDTLLDHGHQLLIIAPTSPYRSYRGARVVRTPHVMLADFPVALPSPVVGQALDGFRPDIIHAAAPFWLGGHAIDYASKRGIPSVAIYQTDVAGYMNRYGLDFATPLLNTVVAAIHKPADLTLAPTPEGVRYLQKLGVKRVEVWGRGVDSELFTPTRRSTPSVQSLRDQLAPRGETIVGYVGRLAPEKQVHRLKELSEIPHVKVVVVGDGPDRFELEDVFHYSPVTFLGRQSGEALANLYASFDLFVHPGEEETFGQTIQEAQASGLPVIAANRGGPRHLINDGITGFLVEPGRWGAYRDVVEMLITNPSRRQILGTAARAAVEKKSWTANNTELLEHYARVMGTRGQLTDVLDSRAA